MFEKKNSVWEIQVVCESFYALWIGKSNLKDKTEFLKKEVMNTQKREGVCGHNRWQREEPHWAEDVGEEDKKKEDEIMAKGTLG